MADIQEAQGIAPEARINASVLVTPSAAQVQGTKSRALAGTALLGGLVAILGALWFDRYALRRRGRQDASPEPLPHVGGVPVAG